MRIYSGFQPSCEVTQPQFLFGYNQPGGLLDRVVRELQLGNNLQILGERRSGKTSLLKCCQARLRAESPHLLPIYINFREKHLIQGYAEANRYLLAQIHHTVMNNRRCAALRGSLSQIRGFSFGSEADETAIIAQLQAVPDVGVDSLLEEYIRFLSRGKFGVAFLFDEYEHFILHTYQGMEGAFFKLRTLSSEPPASPRQVKALTYVVAGAMPWNDICTKIGSPELNNIGSVYEIGGIEVDAFAEMWSHCLATSSADVTALVTGRGVSPVSAWALTGGWPFYGKLLGQFLISNEFDEQAFFELQVKYHLDILWNRLPSDEQALMLKVEQGLIYDRDAVVWLIRRGLVEVGFENEIIPRGELWARYLREKINNHNGTRDLAPATPPVETGAGGVVEELDNLVEDVIDLVTVINETGYNSTLKEVFVCTNQDRPMYRHLREPCLNADKFIPFALSAYNLLFERTTGGKMVDGMERSVALERLPRDFRRSHRMVRIIDSVRHHYGFGHVTTLPTFNASGSGMKIGDVLQYYFNSKAALEDHQFVAFQLAILHDLVAYLTDLRDEMQKQALKPTQ